MNGRIYEFSSRTIDGKPKTLADYKGKVLLIVNVASKCGFTPQYDGLEKLHEKYGPKGLAVLGSRPSSARRSPARTSRSISLHDPLRRKVRHAVQGESKEGPGIDPLFAYLTNLETNPRFGGDIKWNFTKFAVGRTGEVIGRFEPKVEPTSAELENAIQTALA
jgi:glutathione peroxidase